MENRVLQLFNTLNRNIQPVISKTDGLYKIYTCGPTVYRDAHIGNLRSYLMADWIK
jgi:cysteinyl-tRNA synthetase